MKQMLGLVLVVSTMLAVTEALAQPAYPAKPIHLVVGFPSGTQLDIAARWLGQKLAESLGKPVIVENFAGAAGNIASERVARAAPNGYTLLFAAQAQIVVNPRLYKLPFDPVRDLAPISQLYTSPNLLVVHNSLPAKTVRELIKLAKSHPGELTFATGGKGSAPQLAGELFKSMAGIDIREIPYRGVNWAMSDLLSGQVTMMLSPIAIVLPTVREGRLRALAVTSLKRSPTLPDLPTVNEAGVPQYEATVWAGLLAPASTPATIVRKVHLATVNALAQPDIRAKFADLGLEPIGTSPDEFTVVITSEIPKWVRVINELGMKPD